MDYYSILGLKRNATQDDIKKAYRKLAMKNHPDRGGDSNQFAKISEAYEILSDPQKRSQYDNPQPQYRFNSNDFSGMYGFDPFDMMFQGGARRAPRQPKNKDINITYTLDFVDMITGRGITASYKLPSGKIENIDIKIPPGVNSGDVVKFEGYGDDSDQRFPRGNLFLKIRIRRLAGWDRDNLDLITSIKISVLDLILGTEVNISTPEEKNIKLKVPKGAQPGTTFSIPGYGVPNIKTGKKGSIFVKVLAEVPKITDEEILNKINNLKNEINLSK